MKLRFVLLLVFCYGATLGAVPVITDVSPSSGPSAGGTTVVITGSGFETCIICSPAIPPAVYFGNVHARSILIESTERLVVVTPAHLPATVQVTVIDWQGNSSGSVEDLFTFEGQPLDGFEPVLLPVFLPPIQGGYGSVFITSLNGWSESFGTTTIFGLESCMMPVCIPPDPYETSLVLPGRRELASIPSVQPNGTPGRVIWVEKERIDELTLNLRAWDASRESTNFGTEIPIARRQDFRDSIVLLDVPLNPLFRKRLRIYSLSPLPAGAIVTIGGGPEIYVALKSGKNIFEPSYAELADFPSGLGFARVEIRNVEGPGGAPAPPRHDFWAFITVTNNETQHITVISPQ